jgi:chromate transporter
MSEKKHIYFKLFISTFYLSAFTFGGGFVIIPLMKKKFVDELGWLEEEEMLNLVAIAQSSPGAVAVNASLIVGYRIAGVLGALLAILGTVLPPLIILSVISLFYTAFKSNRVVSFALKGMQAGVGAVIADVVICMGGNVIKQKSIVSILIMVGAFISSYYFDINIMFIILISGLIGALQILINRKSKKEEII